MYIALDGVEGCGKSTLASLTHGWLVQMGIDAILTREPGGTKVGAAIREILLHEDMCPEAELFLYLADRAEHIRKVVEPAISSGTWVISDRCFISTLAYQGYARGVMDTESLTELCIKSTGGILPDAVFIIDVDPQISLSRIDRSDRIEREPLEFHRRVREGFLKEAKRFRAVVLDGRLSQKDLLEAVKGHLSGMLKQREAG